MADQSTLVTDKQIVDRLGLVELDDRAIAIASRLDSLVQAVCNRVLKAADYVEWAYGSGTNKQPVVNYPINQLHRVTWGVEEGMLIRCDSKTAARASVRVDSAALTLRRQEGGTENLTELKFTDYTTLAALVAAVNLVTDWVAVSAKGRQSSIMLQPRGGSNALLQSARLNIAYQDIDQVEVDAEAGILQLPNGVFPRGMLNLLIQYNGGYATLPGSLISDILEVAALCYHGVKRDPGLQSERLGPHQWVAKDAPTLNVAIARQLRAWTAPVRLLR